MIYLANTNKERIEDNALFSLLEKVCCLDCFSILICDVDEKVEKSIELVQGMEDCIFDLMVDIFNWDRPQNVRIFKAKVGGL